MSQNPSIIKKVLHMFDPATEMTAGSRGSGETGASLVGERFATVVVIGVGQAGLSAGYHLQRRGFTSALATPAGPRTFVMLDANPEPGGAWQHRWESLRMETVNGIFGLPGMPVPPVDPRESSRDAVPRYFERYESELALPILRPVAVTAVRYASDDADSDFLIDTSVGRWRSRAVLNATGTWNNPLLPRYPGHERFLGRQLHTRDYVRLDDFAGLRVAVVGGGISAVQQLEEISRVAKTFWYTRTEPRFLADGLSPEVEGRDIVARVAVDVEAGNPTGSVVSYTGLPWTPYAIAARDRGVLARRPVFTAIEPTGVREEDGTFTPIDVILWATGFRADLAHLDPLHLRNDRGGITMSGTRVVAHPRLHLIGFGPSQSTVGANRAGRDAVRHLVTTLEAPAAPPGSAA